jgi:endonuclease YncB( thermonuclease family)
MAKTTFATPHFLGRVTYTDKNPFRPDGDTIHIRNPVLIDAGGVHQPKNGAFEVVIGAKKRKVAIAGGKGIPHLTIRLSGIDAPEEHYRGTPFNLKGVEHTLDPSKPHPELCQARWKPSADYLIGALETAGWGLIELDSDIVDDHGRVLGYVYASDKNGTQGKFLTLELLKKGLVFPFLFESAGDYMKPFLAAAKAAHAKGLGVWQHYHDAPLPYSKAFDAPKSQNDPQPPAEDAAPLNIPVVFRRIVDANQLQGLPLKQALQKYDVIDHETGKTVTGDQYQKVPIDNRVWAPQALK